MERRQLDEEIEANLEDILETLEHISTMTHAEMLDYQKELLGELQEQLKGTDLFETLKESFDLMEGDQNDIDQIMQALDDFEI